MIECNSNNLMPSTHHTTRAQFINIGSKILCHKEKVVKLLWQNPHNANSYLSPVCQPLWQRASFQPCIPWTPSSELALTDRPLETPSLCHVVGGYASSAGSRESRDAARRICDETAVQRYTNTTDLSFTVNAEKYCGDYLLTLWVRLRLDLGSDLGSGYG